MQISRRSLMSGGAAMATTASVALRASPTLNAGIASALDAAVHDAISASACPGIQLMIAEEGNALYSRSYGIANLETGSTVTERGVFRIGSLTKQFTAACILKLAAENALLVDAPVARYLPFMSRLPQVSLLELMHHTAGIHDDETDTSCSAGERPKMPEIAQAERIARQAKTFDFDPGTAWLYSNANYIVLGAVVESVTNKPFRDAMAQIVLGPLGLRGAAMDQSADVVTDRVSGYTPVAAGRFDNAAFIEPADAGSAGGMRSTAAELCRWHSALLSNRLFPQKYVKLMLTPGRLRDGRLSGANRFVARDASYGDVQYACGLLVSPPSDPHPSILHYGAINGFASVLQTYLKPRVTFAVLCNGDLGPAMPFRATRKIVEENLLPG